MNPDPMEVQEPPPHRNEKTIFEICREARNFRTNARRCGTLIQPYEFSCPQTAELGFKDGYIYYSSKAIKFAADKEQGFDSEELQKRAATFWVLNEVPFGQLNPLGLNPSIDVGIVKTYGVAYNTLIGKTIIAFARSQQSVLSWIANPDNSMFVRDQLRNSIRSLYVALERLWDKQWTVDNVEDIGTYAINENMIQIMPFRVRGRTPDDEMTPRQGLQLLIQTNILQHWPDDIELAHFNAFLINPNINISGLFLMMISGIFCKDFLLEYMVLGLMRNLLLWARARASQTYCLRFIQLPCPMQQYVEPEPDMTNYMEWHSTDQNNEFKYAETPPNTNGEEKNGTKMI
ncbi:unnamed protein product [Triticum turgidum subsp. durum]|uniref:Uncharacterized protein n=1 Tax=Triticum turgidum subsp. durum TaxID=4567 RepID=A0A9R1P546_TRITD|nr:unnamed protein product [Triticum turgidum subsp. durum]